MSIEIVPDKLCPHVEAGTAERVGGVHFAAAEPPVSVGMCSQCLAWCNNHLEKIVPLNSDAAELKRQWNDDEVIDAEYVDGEP